ncbi:MAG: hypothetical protein WCJ29_06065 [bacterium]
MTQQAFRMVLSLSILSIFALGCGNCNPTNTKLDGGVQQARMHGPGRPGAVRDIVKNAMRVRAPAIEPKATTGSVSQLTQGLSGEDGGRSIDVDFAGTNVNFKNLYFTLGPLFREVYEYDDGGTPINSYISLAYHGALLAILPDGTSSTIYEFTDPLDDERFSSGYSQATNYEGEKMYTPRSLMLGTAVDKIGNIYVSSNGAMDILKFSSDGSRTTFVTLTSGVGDIKIIGYNMFVTLLPYFDTDLATILVPPQVLRIPLATGVPEQIALLPETPNLNGFGAKTVELAYGDGGIHYTYIATTMAYALGVSPENEIYVTSGFSQRVYQMINDGDGGYQTTVYAEGIEGISSISTSPISECLYVTQPAVVLFGESVDASVQYVYERLPKIMAICPGAQVEEFLVLEPYASIDPDEALGGFAFEINNRLVAFGELHTVLVDTNGNLILADPIRNMITAIQVIHQTDGGPDGGSDSGQ